ncbi:MAG: carbohydrate-binding domain-containing protein [Clostridiales bacterium]|jgi:hypothetical protein|nr:carbohydrate-binding domain-containing protein [Clostridiales bacterium]
MYKLILALLLVSTMALAGCDNGAVTNTEALDNAGTHITSYEFAPEDTDAEWDESEAVLVRLNDVTGDYIIEEAGTYVLSGELKDGQIRVDAGKNDIVRLVLNGADIHNGDGPAVYALQSEKLVIVLADGAENSISDGAEYKVAGDANEPDAAVFSQDDITLTGKGSLTVSASHNHGIRSQNVLAVTGGVITVDSIGDALRGKEGFAVKDGEFTLNAGGDAVQSNGADEDQGFVVIYGGVFNMKSSEDGIQAENSLAITGGTFDITTGGGSANAPVHTEDFGGWGMPNQQQAAAVEEGVSMKALKSGKLTYVSGGTFVIDAEDDGVHSNGYVLITGGNLDVKTGDDGFHADEALEVTGGEINISYCYEGIEGLSVTVSGGDINVTASDDAVNAAGGAGGSAEWGGPMGRDSFAANGDIFIRITGGSMDVYAGFDGIDSNGNVFLDGGTVKVSGPSQGMEGAIDLDGALLINGGELITAGSVMNVSQDSEQPSILISYGSQQPAGSVISIKDAEGKTVLEYTSRIGFAMSGFTSPAFKQNETYTLYIDGEKRADITISGAVTSLSDNGGVYNGGMGGGRGGRGGWGGFGGQPGEGQPFPDGQRPDGGQGFPNESERPEAASPPAGNSNSGNGN